jgi:hypothetical protein
MAQEKKKSAIVIGKLCSYCPAISGLLALPSDTDVVFKQAQELGESQRLRAWQRQVSR